MPGTATDFPEKPFHSSHALFRMFRKMQTGLCIEQNHFRYFRYEVWWYWC